MPAKRFAAHLRGASGSLALNAAVIKHGRAAFSMQVLVNKMSKADADMYEGAMIERIGTESPRGYNLTKGGEGMTGYVFNADSRAKMSAAKIGRKQSPEAILKRAESKRRFWSDPEVRARWSQKQRQRFSDPAVRARMSASAKARVWTDDQKKAHSEASKKSWTNPDFRSRMSAHLSCPDLIRRRNIAIKAAHSTPEARAALSARQTAYMADPEVRRRLSDKMKQVFSVKK